MNQGCGEVGECRRFCLAVCWSLATFVSLIVGMLSLDRLQADDPQDHTTHLVTAIVSLGLAGILLLVWVVSYLWRAHLRRRDRRRAMVLNYEPLPV